MRVSSAARRLGGSALLAGVLATALSLQAGAQVLPAPTAQPPVRLAPEPGDELTISVLTMGVGAEVWERFGHNAIVVEDRNRGTSIAYNYGMFSFRQENFLLKFVQGRMLYWMAGYPTADDVPRYIDRQRSVWQQELNLTPAQRVALRDFLEWNAQEEHKYYRYDYYLDNCSTRVRDALDRVLGGAIERQSRMPGHSFRFHTQRLNTHNPRLYTGLMLALGASADQPRTRWEEMFLPLKLHEYLREIRLPDSAGGFVPLVKSERVLYESTTYQVREAPPAWWPGFLAIGVALGGLLAWAGARYGRTGAGRTVFVFPATTVALLLGLGGMILAGLWAFTDHVMAGRNQNVLQLHDLTLVLGLLLPWARASRPGVVRAVRVLAWLVAGLSLAGVLLKLLPVGPQVNGQVLALLVPINLGLVAGVLAATRPAPRPA